VLVGAEEGDENQQDGEEDESSDLLAQGSISILRHRRALRLHAEYRFLLIASSLTALSLTVSPLTAS
jgi:hypothetical protein